MEHQSEPSAPPAGEQGARRTDRALTVPNVISLTRLALLPVFVWLLFGQEDRVAAAVLLGVIGSTDFVDGWIARRFDQVSELGKVLDPVADRLLFFVGLGAILIDGSIPVWFAVAVLAREAAVTVGTLALAGLGARRVEVTWFGKAGSFLLMFAVPFFLASHGELRWADEVEVLAWLTGLPGLLLSWYSAALYVPLGLRALREGKADRAGVRSDP